MNTISPYEPRCFSRLEVWQIHDVRLKPYLITTEREVEKPAALIRSAYRYTLGTLPAVREEEAADHALGYVILHTGKMANWLLIHWWAHQDVAMRLLAASDVGLENFISNDEKRFHACVWEHVVIDHERGAWVRNMMTEQNDASGYLNDRLPDGCY